MKRAELHYLTDITTYCLFLSTLSTGLLLRFSFPHGPRPQFRGGGDGEAHKLFMLLSKHEWSEIHFYLSLALVTAILIHLTLHAKWIASLAWGTKESPRSGAHRWAVIALCFITLVAVIAPFIV